MFEGVNIPRHRPRGQVYRGLFGPSLLTRWLGRPLSGTVGDADTSAGREDKLMAQQDCVQYWYCTVYWECQQRLDSLGPGQQGCTAQARTDLALSQSFPGGCDAVLRRQPEGTASRSIVSGPGGQLHPSVLSTGDGRAVVENTRTSRHARRSRHC